MLGKAMRRTRVKNSASSHAATAMTIHMPTLPLNFHDRYPVAPRNKANANRHENIAKAAEEAKLFVVGRCDEFERLARAFQRAQTFSLFGGDDAPLDAFGQNVVGHHRYRLSPDKVSRNRRLRKRSGLDGF